MSLTAPTPMAPMAPPAPAPSPAPAGPSWLAVVNAWQASHRKFLVAVVGPLLLVAQHYLGAGTLPFSWYEVVVGEAVALGVTTVTNTPSPL
jgi:hypothetical protein